MQTHHTTSVGTGLLGTATSIGAAATSLLPHVETWMRIGSLAIGIVVGILTGIKVIRDLLKK
jgi:hypothetical protein